MTIIKLLIKNSTIMLPDKLSKSWNNQQIALVAGTDTLILKRTEKDRPVRLLSDIATRNTLPRMNRRALNREIAAYRRSRK